MLEFILLLMAGVLLSNIIGRFMPRLSVPIVQILLGILTAQLPMHYHMELEPETFLILFIAPIVYHNGVHADKPFLWKLRGVIFSFAFGLVILGVVMGGFVIHWLIPSIPVAAACAMIAALGPTDVVAVSVFSKSVDIPQALMSILDGECLFNDASGIVSFQFAVAAMATGSFSAANAGIRLAMIAAGGVLVGLVLTAGKRLLTVWLRSLGLENVTLHLLLELLTPFLLYIAAETMGVSGVFAAVTSGLLHSYYKRLLTAQNASFNTASESVWSMMSFTLDGLIFVILGTQIPDIARMVGEVAFPVGYLGLFGIIAAVTAFIYLLRFTWSLVFVGKDVSGGAMGRVRSALLLTLAGTRGAVTLAIVLSLPVTLEGIGDFPQRDLLVLITAGVIMCTLLAANFLLPVIAGRKDSADSGLGVNIRLLEGVITEMNASRTPENRAAVQRIAIVYFTRIAELRKKEHMKPVERQEERRTRDLIAGWRMERVERMFNEGDIDEDTRDLYMETAASMESRRGRRLKWFAYRFLLKFLPSSRRKSEEDQVKLAHLKTYLDLTRKTDAYALRRLQEAGALNPAVLRGVLSTFGATASFMSDEVDLWGTSDGEELRKAAERAFQLERDRIQSMLESGEIDRETAKDFRHETSQIESLLGEEIWSM